MRGVKSGASAIIIRSSFWNVIQLCCDAQLNWLKSLGVQSQYSWIVAGKVIILFVTMMETASFLWIVDNVGVTSTTAGVTVIVSDGGRGEGLTDGFDVLGELISIVGGTISVTVLFLQPPNNKQKLRMAQIVLTFIMHSPFLHLSIRFYNYR